jgi:hypothetical protein
MGGNVLYKKLGELRLQGPHDVTVAPHIDA